MVPRPLSAIRDETSGRMLAMPDHDERRAGADLWVMAILSAGWIEAENKRIVDFRVQ
jgi:hypothetical protein